MRKLLSLAFACVCFSLFSSAQNQQKFTFGVKAGGTLNKFYGEKYDGKKLDQEHFIGGINININAEIALSRSLYLQPGIGFTTKGTKNDYPSFDIKTTQTVLSYFELPLNFIYKLRLGKGKAIFGAGGYFAYAAGGKYKEDPDVYQVPKKIVFKKYVKITDPRRTYFKRTDVGLNVLAGYSLPSALSMEFDAQFGMASILPDFESSPSSNTKYKNLSLGVSLGYRFHCRKK